ncbi:MAG: sulfite exporter TauE/SafE family protein [Candidatus Binataceae bacterium]
MSPGRVVLLVAAGVVSGVTNTLVGGGSVIITPLLLNLPRPAKLATGTNQLAHLAGCLTRVYKYQRAKVLNWREGLEMAVPVTIGAAIGAESALLVSGHVLKRALVGAVVSYYRKLWIDDGMKKAAYPCA